MVEKAECGSKCKVVKMEKVKSRKKFEAPLLRKANSWREAGGGRREAGNGKWRGRVTSFANFIVVRRKHHLPFYMY